MSEAASMREKLIRLAEKAYENALDLYFVKVEREGDKVQLTLGPFTFTMPVEMARKLALRLYEKAFENEVIL